MITQDELKRILEYNPDEGTFTWLNNQEVHNKVRGLPAGCLKPHSVDPNRKDLVIQINGKKYPAQNIAFLYMTGNLPKIMVDHIDGDPLNYKWANLREADWQLNSQNRKTSKNNILGTKNIRKKGSGFQVRKSINGKEYVKTLPTLEEAIEYRDSLILSITKDPTLLRNTDKQEN